MKNAFSLRSEASIGRTPFVLLAVVGLCFGVAVGVLSTVSPPAAGALAVIALTVVLARGVPDLAGLALILVIGVPITAAGDSGNSFLSIPLGPINPPFQILVVIGIAVLTVVMASDETLSYLLAVLRRGASGTVLIWLTACLVLLLLGAGRNGLPAAGRQFMYFSVYLWVVPVIIVSRRRAPHALSVLLALVLVGASLCGALALAAFAVAPLRAFFFSATEWARSARIYFDGASVYVLVLPLALLLAGSKSAGRLRLLGLVSSLLMIGSMVVTQTRTLMAAAVLNVILVALLPGMWKLGVRRWRILGSVALIVLVFVIALPIAAALGVRSATILPQELAQRFSWVDSISSDPNYQYRQVQVDIAMSKWRTSPATIVSGQGLGAAMGMPGRAPDSAWVDNAWATLAAQGGLIALAPFALVLVAAFVSFVRVARSPADPLERLIARALAVSLPLLLVDSTLFTMHLIHSPGVIVTLCTLLAAADVVWFFHRRATTSVPAPRSRG
jgi:O-antigen ligase